MAQSPTWVLLFILFYLFSPINGQAISTIPSTVYSNQAVLVSWTHKNCVSSMPFQLDLCPSNGLSSCTRISTPTAQSYTFTVNPRLQGSYNFKLTYYGLSQGCKPSTVTTNNFMIEQCGTLRIDTQPIAVVTPVNTPATFMTRVSGTAVSYQWYLNGAALPNAHSNVFSIASVRPENEGQYYARAIDPCGKSVTTVSVSLTVCRPLSIDFADPEIEVLFGGSRTIVIEASGTGLTFEWKRGAIVLSTTTNTYTINDATQAQTGIYSVRVTDACRQVRSVTFTVRIFPFVIQQDPSRVTRLFLDEVATLTVVAVGETNLNYQWHRNGEVIVGETQPTITLEPFTWSMNGTVYTVLVSDQRNILMSNPATIMAQPAPSIGALLPSTTRALFIGQSVDFQLAVFEGISLNFAWFIGDALLGSGPDLNPFKVTITSVDQDGAEVRVNVSNPNGFEMSSPYPLAVENPPAFSRPRPRTITLLLGEVFTIDLSREVLGNNVTVQWLRNNETITGEKTATLTLPPYDLVVSTYQLVASNPSGTTYGPVLTISPEPAPRITRAVDNVRFFIGESPTLTVPVAGRGVSFRWFRENELIANSNTTTMQFPALQTEDNESEVKFEAYNANGATSATFKLQLESPPTIARSPTAAFPFLYQNVVLSTRARGRSLSFEWHLTPALNFEIIADRTTATESYIMIKDVRENFRAYAIVRNPAGSATTDSARVVIRGPPDIVTFTPVTYVIIDQFAEVSVVATGSDLSYTWYLNGVVRRPVNSTSDSYFIPRVTGSMEGDIYTVTVANPSGSVTRDTRISVIRSPQIIRPPEINYKIFTGSPFNITVDATGGFVYYIWHHSDVLVQNSTSNVLRIDSASPSVQGTYTLTLLNVAGKYGPITFTVEVTDVQFSRNHDIQVNNFVGQRLELSVTINTSVRESEMTFSWLKNRVRIDGVTGTRLVIPNLNESHVGEYFLRLGHPLFSTNYENIVAAVKLLGPPTLDRRLENVRVKSGQTASFSVTAYPKNQLQFQWSRNGINITEGGNESAFVINEAELDMDGDVFSVIAFNPAGYQISNDVVLNVDLADSWIIFILVACLLIFVGSVTATVIIVRRKLKERKNITYNKATFGIDKVLYPISKTWVPPETSTLCSAEKLPVVFSKTALDFGIHGDQFDLNAEYYDTVNIRWKSSMAAKSGVKSKKQNYDILTPDPNSPTDMAIPLLKMGKKKSLTIVFHVPETHKYTLTAQPDDIELQPRSKRRTNNENDKDPTAVDVDFSFKINITTNVSVLIGVEFPDLDKHFFLTLDASSRLSPWIDIDEIKIDEKPIGEGGFGIVFKGEYRGQIVASKMLKMQDLLDDDNLEEFEREIKLLSILRHKNIVSFVGASKLKGKLAIVTEFIPNGSLEQFLHKKAVPYLMKLRIALETAQAIQFLHNNNVLHRDIKVENVLLSSLDLQSNAAIVKLSDFGSARTISDQRAATFTKGIGTPIYMAPEVLSNKKYDTKADIFSFGVLLWVLISQKEPYTAFSHSWDVAKFVIDGNREAIPAGCPYDYATLLRQCWDQEPESRPSIQEVVEALSGMYARGLENDTKQ